MSAELSGLMGGEVQATELQELAVMIKAAQVARLGQDRHGVYGSDPGDLPKTLGVLQFSHPPQGFCLDGVAMPNELAHLHNHQLVHGNSSGIVSHRQSGRGAGRVVNIGQESGFADLAPHQVPDGSDERLLAQGGHRARRRELMEETEEPLRTGVVAEAVHLGKIQRQIVGLQTMQDFGLVLRDRLMGLGQFLPIRYPFRQRIVVPLHLALGQHVQHHLGILRIVLIPSVVQRFAHPGQSH